jgi:hypothetical protein
MCAQQRTYSDAPKTKHDGFFINKGTLELAEESENSSNAFVPIPTICLCVLCAMI